MIVEEDHEAWDQYPEHRWLFNKLEVALRMGYRAGPSGVPIKKAGDYIVRPTYNLYGMGIGARKMYLDPEKDSEDMIALAHVPPGYFWCEYLEGEHLSIDCHRVEDRWVPFCTTRGVHRSEDDLVMFDYWERIDTPETFKLPRFIHQGVSSPRYLNVETKGNNIFEFHLRSGNDHFWNYSVGTIMYPIWNTDPEDDRSDLPFVGNMHEDSYMYSAFGHLDNIRLGYRVKEPNKA